MPGVVVRDALDVAEPHRQHGLGAPRRLDPALLVDAQHDGVVRRVQVQTDDVAHLLDEGRVGGQLERPLPVGLHPNRPNQRATVLLDTPLRSAIERTVQWVALGGGELSAALMTSATRLSPWLRGRPGAQLVVQALDALLQVAAAPLADGGPAQPHALGDGGVGLAGGAGEHDLGAAHEGVGQRPGAGDGEQLRLGVVVKGQGSDGASAGHGELLQ